MTPSSSDKSLETLKGMVEDLDLTPEDLLMVLSSVVSLKKSKNKEEKTNKIFQDKIYLWENTKDSFIYRDGRTKSGNYYIRIYCKETKKVFTKVSEHHQEKKVLYLVERYILRLMEDSSEGRKPSH